MEMDRTVRRALVNRIVADTGIDGYAAMAMVADVAERGAESPHAEVVATAAHRMMAPILEAWGRAFTSLAESFQKMTAALAPAVKALNEANWRGGAG